MRILKIFILSLISAAVTATAQTQSGQYRGYRAAQRLLSERLAESQTGISFLPYAGGNYSATGLLALLGTFDDSGSGQREFRNGQPNSVNLLLWYLVLDGLSENIGGTCVGERGLPLAPAFRSKLMALCRWPAEAAKSEAAMQDFWLAVMGYDAPESEYRAWRDFFLQSRFAGLPAPQAVRAMFLAIVFNPHFLLTK